MRTYTSAQDAAILSVSREVSMQVTINGSTTQWPVTEFQTDAQMTDTPDAISLMGGVAARQATFKIDHTFAKSISPYQGPVPAAYPLPIGASVQISISFWPDDNRSGTPTYTANVFTGYVITVPRINGTSEISVTAQDPSYLLATNVTLPAVGAIAGFHPAPNADPGFSSLAVIEQALRACGQYLTAPPCLSGPARTAYTMLSSSGYGGHIPDVGSITRPFLQYTARTVGVFAPDIIAYDQIMYQYNQDLTNVADFKVFKVDSWVKTQASLKLFQAGVGFNEFNINTDSSGRVTVQAGASALATFSTPNVADGNWHHLMISLTAATIAAGGAMTATVFVDGASYGTQSIGTLSKATQWGSFFWVGDVAVTSAALWVECLDVTFVPTGGAYTEPGPRYGQTAPLASSVTATTARLQAIVPQTDNAWQLIQSVAEAEGALCWFDEDGKFIFEPRSLWLSRRLNPAVRTFDATSVADAGFSYSRDGLRRSVTANYSTVTAQASTAASPAYVAAATLTFPPGYSTQAITTTELFFNPSPPAIGASNAVGNSWVVPVAASSVGDPAAVVLTGGVGVIITATSTGFVIGIGNPYSYPIALWNPTPGTIPQGPALIIHGTKIITSDPITVTAAGNPSAKTDLILPDNPWRQSGAITQQLVFAAAADCYNAIPVFENIDVPGDPRIQLGDVITVQVPIVPTGVQCVVTNLQHTGNPTTSYRMLLGIRPVGAPTGWLAGVTGRSESGTTTYAPLA